MLPPVIRILAPKGKQTTGHVLQLLCRVKPGVSAKRQGVGDVTTEGIEVYVAAQAREGEANKAVQQVLSEVRKQ